MCNSFFCIIDFERDYWFFAVILFSIEEYS